MEISHNILLICGILLATLKCTTACADVEYSIQVTKVPKTLSYQQAVSNCQADGKELCSSKTLCKDGKTPYTGVIPGDHWVPVADSSNEWMQIGNNPHRPCTLHSTLGAKPYWGVVNSARSYKGNVFCCKIKPKEDNTGITIKTVPNTISYPQALANCQTDAKELCTSQDICKDGKTPYNGPFSGDNWVPVKDSLNEWLQIGNSPHRPCILHSTLGSKPVWGLTNGAHNYRGKLFCCEKKPPEIGIFLKSVAKTITYNQAISTCKSDGKQLCNSTEICKIGQTPVSGVVPGDHWVPVRNSGNEWLQIGNSPHKTCILHSQLGSKPGWGVTPSKHQFKGYLFCCKN